MSLYTWNQRILIVDDERDIAQGYKEIICPAQKTEVLSSRSKRVSEQTELDKFSFHVDLAYSVEETLKLVKKSIENGQPYSLGFFDVLLGPGKDGIELVKEIFAIDPSIYAVFVTAYHDRSVDAIRTYLGENSLERWDYLNKPVNDGEILQKARNYNSLWNLKKEREQKDNELNNLRRRILDSERSSSIAAISRSVTHEFGNILMQIMGKADISRKKSADDMRRALEIILEASERANKILDRFKTASHADVTEEKKHIYIHEIIEKCLELMEFQIKKTNTKISKGRMELVKVPMNSTTFLQVLLNLFINAIHAMGDAGEINIELSKDGESAIIVIRDNGPGVSEKIFDQVLVPFFTTKGSSGSGLGLAICKEIIEVEHGGDLILKNISPHGLEVTIKLPLVDPLEEA
ncbi:MAG: hybrid sensor histidine kinase/response regulator [Bdellovibrionales bacterium]|nr:hybrid sensor histidine kinase/response regulator [Bdellovibrionales bacterium]